MSPEATIRGCTREAIDFRLEITARMTVRGAGAPEIARFLRISVRQVQRYRKMLHEGRKSTRQHRTERIAP